MSPTADRIDVLDAGGHSIGWVDPRSGARNLTDPDHAEAFEDMVNFWLTSAGVDGEPLARRSEPSDSGKPNAHFRVNEVRFPDPPVVRSLVIPLRPLG